MKKGLTVPKPQWWKHLRPYWKKKFWKKQRRADQKEIKDVQAVAPHTDL